MKAIKVRQVELNIGLSNNPQQHIEDYIDLIRSVDISAFSSGLEVVDGTYNDKVERTVKVLAASVKDEASILDSVEKLCVIYEQECIPVLIDGADGTLVYHPRYKGEKMLFDMQYFLR